MEQTSPENENKGRKLALIVRIPVSIFRLCFYA
ncbi:unnamed protein product [Schistosoma curassoni]|nr:unnamed protein product [Schistosoma curassoni]